MSGSFSLVRPMVLAPSAGDPNNLAICVVSQIEDAPLDLPELAGKENDGVPGLLLDQAVG